jgi:signal peptidase II
MKLLAPIYALTNPTRPVSRVTFVILALVTCVLDQLSKMMVVLFLPESIPVPLVPGLLDLRHVVNTGAAWSIASGHTSMLAAFSILISVVITVMAWRFGPAEKGLRVGLGLILGGAVGNLIDRVRLGYVVDFIDAHWFDKAHWPVFNVADTAICIGIGLWLVASMRYAPREKTAKQSS